MKYCRLYLAFCAALICLSGCASEPEGPDAFIAVATNFAEIAAQIEIDFEAVVDYDISLATGSTGQLYAQIINGAPFDVLLAADQARPEKLEQAGLGVEGSRFTYGLGQLALWSPAISPVNEQALAQGGFRKLAIANPALAPYGKAAQEALDVLGLSETLSPKIVQGQNIGQAYGLVATGNAELGFVALAAVIQAEPSQKGYYWVVPQHFYSPIKQDAVLLARAKDNDAAKAFLDYLKSDAAKAVMSAYGYVPL